MPAVPYTGVPSVQPSSQGAPSYSTQAVGEAFGKSIATATEGIGKEVSHFGDEIFKRAMALQDLKNETEAKNADAQYMIEAGKLHAEYSSLQGLNAQEAFPKYQKDLDGLRTQMRDGLSNEMAKKMFDSSSLSVMGRTIFNGAGHAATESKKAADGAMNAKIDASLSEIGQNYKNDIAVRRLTGSIENEVRNKADLWGWTPEQTENEVGKVRSKAIAHQIVGMSQTDPTGAKDLFDEKKDQLHGDDLYRVEHTVNTQMRGVGARVISSQVMQEVMKPRGPDEKEPSFTDMEADVRKRAEVAHPDDPMFPDFAVQRFRSDWGHYKQAQRWEKDENQNAIAKGLIEGVNGRPFANIDELRAAGYGANYDALSSKEQLALWGQIQRRFRSWDVETKREELQQLKGMAIVDRSKFLEIDPSKYNLSTAAQNEILKLQQQYRSKAEEDPVVGRALRILGPVFNNMEPSVKVNKKEYEAQYFQIVGALQDALHYEQAAKGGKPLTSTEIEDIGRRVARNMKPTQAVKELEWWHIPTSPVYGIYKAGQQAFSGGGAERMFATTPSVKDADRIRVELTSKLGAEPSEKEIQREYVFQQYKQLKRSSAGESDKP